MFRFLFFYDVTPSGRNCPRKIQKGKRTGDRRGLTLLFPCAIVPLARSEGALFERNGSRIRRRLKCLFLIRLFCCNQGGNAQWTFCDGNIGTLYFKYLSAAFGSALISSIYGIVDMAMVGQYQGPDGTAALAVVAPVWNVIYSLGLLMGIGGSVIFSTKRGSGMSGDGEDDAVFYRGGHRHRSFWRRSRWVGLILFRRARF